MHGPFVVARGSDRRGAGRRVGGPMIHGTLLGTRVHGTASTTGSGTRPRTGT